MKEERVEKRKDDKDCKPSVYIYIFFCIMYISVNIYRELLCAQHYPSCLNLVTLSISYSLVLQGHYYSTLHTKSNWWNQWLREPENFASGPFINGKKCLSSSLKACGFPVIPLHCSCTNVYLITSYTLLQNTIGKSITQLLKLQNIFPFPIKNISFLFFHLQSIRKTACPAHWWRGPAFSGQQTCFCRPQTLLWRLWTQQQHQRVCC